MLVSYGAMSNGDLKAVDKVIKVARELDRYHGFGSIPQSFAAPGPVAPPPLALPEPPAMLPAPAVEDVRDWAANEPRDAAPRE
jgi:hypothetical protein